MLSITSTKKLNNGVEMPVFGLGTWRTQGEDEMRGAVKAALDAGYIHIDTAAGYGNEPELGRAIKDFGDRKKLWLTSKLWNSMHGDPEAALEQTLTDLGTDYLDLYLIHWPAPRRGLYVSVWKKFCEFLKDGRCRAIGVSNFRPDEIERCIDATGVVPMINQVERHPLFQQKELADYCTGKGIVMEAYSPLGSLGNLPEIAPSVEPIAKKHGVSVPQAIIRWQLQSGWIVIPKSVRPERIRENAAIFNFELDADDMKAFAAIDCGKRFLPDADIGPN